MLISRIRTSIAHASLHTDSASDKMWVSLIYSNTATTLFSSCVEINSTLFFVHIDLVCVRFANVSIAANNDCPFDSILSFVILPNTQRWGGRRKRKKKCVRSLVGLCTANFFFLLPFWLYLHVYLDSLFWLHQFRQSYAVSRKWLRRR